MADEILPTPPLPPWQPGDNDTQQRPPSRPRPDKTPEKEQPAETPGKRPPSEGLIDEYV